MKDGFKRVRGKCIQRELQICEEAAALIRRHLGPLDIGKIDLAVKANPGVGKHANGVYAGGFMEVKKLGSAGAYAATDEDDLWTIAVHELIHAYQEQSGLSGWRDGRDTFCDVIESRTYHKKACEMHARLAEGYINAVRKVESGEMSAATFSKYFRNDHLNPNYALAIVQRRFPEEYDSSSE